MWRIFNGQAVLANQEAANQEPHEPLVVTEETADTLIGESLECLGCGLGVNRSYAFQ